ncbi:MAG: TonB-dependent receptor [Gemmatimonadales bacterium]|nr:TonB-dependent receptor [Gemmatimonadales bacterium]
MMTRFTRWLLALANLALLSSLPNTVVAQEPTGRVTGRVVDAAQGAPIAGAIVELVGTSTPHRTSTSLDGRYTFLTVPAGEVGIRVRMIGFGPKLVTGVRVPVNGVATQDVSLNAETVQLEELNVTAAAERGTVADALNEQRNSVGVVNAVTAEEISRSPDGDAAAAVQRVSGVTVQEGKYVFVRGLGERYTTTSLNGARIPSPEPERKVVPLDLFPSGLIQAITTAKTFTPDLPGDFSGAQVNIRTREFPATRQFTVSTSTGYNTRATGTAMLRAPNAGLEWLAFGANKRGLPGLVRDAGVFDPPPSQTDVNRMVESFRNAWSAPSRSGLPSSSLALSLGGSDPIFGQSIGYLLSATYSYSQEVQQDQRRAFALPLATPGEVAEIDRFEGSTGRASVGLGTLASLSTSIGASTRLSLNTSYNRTADNDARFEAGLSENHGSELEVTRLRYIERSVLSMQLQGEHRIGARHSLDWSASRSRVTRDEPDRSEMVYFVGTDASGQRQTPAWFSASNEGAVRTFAALDESSSEAAGNYGLQLGSRDRPHQIRIGGLYRSTTRNANNASYSIASSLPSSARTLKPEEIFDGRFSSGDQAYFRVTPLSAGGSYAASDRLVAGYVMGQYFLTPRIEILAGARVERSTVRVTTEPTVGSTVITAPEYTDVLPSLGVNVRLSETQTLRFAATQTLARPEYRELSPVQYREVIGGENLLGNAELKRSLIKNLDARWEWYPNPMEVISVGLFAKQFTDPIERVYLATSGTRVVSFLNAESAENYGIELEGRKNLRFVSPSLVNFSAHANATVIHSRIRIGGEGLASRLNDERAMVGQAPYVFNSGLTYTSGSGRFSATALYNIVGRRIVNAAEAPLPDVYEQARHALDLSLRFPVIAGIKGKMDFKNILDSPYQIEQGTVVREYYRSGRVVSFGLSWQPTL